MPIDLARELNIPRDEASTYMKRYFERYPEIQNVLDSLFNRRQNMVLRKQCLVVNVRSLILTALIKIKERLRNESLLNAPVQGAAADIMKLAMCRVPAVLEEKFPTATMLLQVHDELVLECYPR